MSETDPHPGTVFVAERAHPASPLVQLWIGIVAVGWFLLQEFLPGGNGLAEFDDFQLSELPRLLGSLPWWVLGLVSFLAVGLALGYWGWWTTRFVIDDRELRIENTGAFSESKRIAFGRIQSIDIKQPLAARVLGLAELTIDVGADSSTKLSFLKRSRATELRDQLMARARGARAAAPVPPRAEASRWNDLSVNDRILIRLSPGDLIVGAVLSLELWFLLLALLVPLLVGIVSDEPLLAGGGLIPIALGIGGFVSQRVLKQFNYTLAETPTGLRITRGLTTLASQTIPVHRVQLIKISQPILWRWLGKARVDLVVLGLGELEEGNLSTLLLPIGDARQVRTALHAVWPGFEMDGLRFIGPPARARWLDPLAHSWIGYALTDEVVVVRNGFATRRQVIIPHARIQSAHLAQGPVERRADVANVLLDTTGLSGSTTIVHMDAAAARALVFAEMDRAKQSRMTELFDPDDAARGPAPVDAPYPASPPTPPLHRRPPEEAAPVRPDR